MTAGQLRTPQRTRPFRRFELCLADGQRIPLPHQSFLRAATGPSPRGNHALAYDSRRGVVVLFGGYDANGLDGETWEWDGETWTLRSADGPNPREGHRLCYDSVRGVTILLGGYTDDYNAETWEWDGSTWTRLGTTGPTPRTNHALSYDSRRGVTVLFGGYFGGDFDAQTWEYGITRGPACNGSIAGAYKRGASVKGKLRGYDADAAYEVQLLDRDGNVVDSQRVTTNGNGNKGFRFNNVNCDLATHKVRNAACGQQQDVKKACR